MNKQEKQEKQGREEKEDDKMFALIAWLLIALVVYVVFSPVSEKTAMQIDEQMQMEEYFFEENSLDNDV
jgi:hypothetical protein